MKRAAWLLLLASAVAHASPTPLVIPPAQWREDPEASSELSQRAAAANLLGDVRATTAAQTYFPAERGAALFVTRASAETGPDHGAAARAARDAFLAAPERAKVLGGAITVADTKEAAEASLHVVTLTWSDAGPGLTFTSRLVIAANKLGVVAASGECMWSRDAAPATIEACTKALASVDTGIPVADRVPVVLAATSAPPPAAPPPTRPAGSRPMAEPPRLDDSDRLRMTPMQISHSSRQTDRRPVYIGAGIVVLAVVFWWNRRRRDEIDRARANEEGREVGTAAPVTDDDADDLRAAARGDALKDEDA